MATNNFKPILISFDEDSFKKAEKYAKEKLEILDEASVWIHKTLDLKRIKLKKFSNNMVEYFYNALLLKYSKENTLGLSAEKLCFVKEIDVKPLQELQTKYESMKEQEITFPDGVPSAIVSRKKFETWSENEKQNKIIIASNSLIKEVNDISKYCRVVPFSIVQATSGLIRYDMVKQKYYVAPEEVRRER